MAVLFILLTRAEVVELVDARRSGRRGSNPVGVRVPPSAPSLTYTSLRAIRVKYPVYLPQLWCIEETTLRKFSSLNTSNLSTKHNRYSDED